MERIDTIKAVHAQLRAAGRLRAQGLADGSACADVEGHLLELVGGSSWPEGEKAGDPMQSAPAQQSATPAPAPKRKSSAYTSRSKRQAPESGRLDLPSVSLHIVAAALRGMNSRGGFVGLRALANRLRRHHGCEQIHPLALTVRLQRLGIPLRNFGGYYVDTGHPEIRRIIKEA